MTLFILLIFTLHFSFLVDLAQILGRRLIMEPRHDVTQKEAEAGRGQCSAYGPLRGLVPAQAGRPAPPSSLPPAGSSPGTPPNQLHASLGNRS